MDLAATTPTTADGADRPLLVEHRDGVCRLTINRPERRNAFGVETIRAFADELRRVASDASVRVLVVTGAGGHFSSGADLKERATMSAAERFAHSRQIASTLALLAELPVATIASIDGYALGGGCELALACDLRILSDRAVMGLTETRIGAFPGAGGTQRLTRIVGPAAAKELIFTGRRVDADEALRLGLATTVVPVDRLGAASDEVAATIARNAPLGVSYAKKAIDLGLENHISAGLEFESAAARLVLGSEDYAEGLAAFAERREPRFRGV